MKNPLEAQYSVLPCSECELQPESMTTQKLPQYGSGWDYTYICRHNGVGHRARSMWESSEYHAAATWNYMIRSRDA